MGGAKSQRRLFLLCGLEGLVFTLDRLDQGLTELAGGGETRLVGMTAERCTSKMW